MQCRLCNNSIEFNAAKGDFEPTLSAGEVFISRRSSRPVRLVKCQFCELVQIMGVQDSVEIAKLYEGLEDPHFLGEEDNRKTSFEFDLTRMVQAGVQPKRILEIGAFVGSGAIALNSHFQSAYYLGVEPSHWAVQVARSRGVNVLHGCVGTPLPEGEFDLIILWDVIEHLENPRELFVWLQNFISDQAFIFINTPDWNSKWRRLMNSKWWFVEPQHRTYFTPQSLEKMTAHFGWSPVEVWAHRKIRSLWYLLGKIHPLFKKANEKKWLPQIGVKYQPGQVSMLLEKRSVR